MKNKFQLIVVAALLAMSTSSCVVTHHVHYKPVVQEGRGERVDSTFTVDYGTFTLGYNVDGRVLMNNRSDSVVYIDMTRSCMVDTFGVQHSFYTKEFPSLTNLEATALLFGKSGGFDLVPENVPGRYVGIRPHSSVYLPFPALLRPEDSQLYGEGGKYPLVVPCGSHVMYYTTEVFLPTWRKLRVDLTTDYEVASTSNEDFVEAEQYSNELSEDAPDIVQRSQLSTAGMGGRIAIVSTFLMVGVVVPFIILVSRTPFYPR